MRRRSLLRFCSALVFLGGVVSTTQGAVTDRIVGGTGTRPVVLADSISPKVRAANGTADTGMADGGLTLSSITLRFSMTPVQRAALKQMLIDQQTPGSARYRQWLTPEQYAEQFGLSSGDVATVSQWLISQGFKISETARSRTFIRFSGTVAQAEAAFQTSIHRISVNAGGVVEEHIANVTAISLPSGIAQVVGSVDGLNDFRLRPRVRVHREQGGSGSKYTSAVSGNTYIAPGDFYTIYDVKPLLTSSIDGNGVAIAVAGQTDININDVAAFRTAAGLSVNLPQLKLVAGSSDPGIVSGDLDEAQLDVEWSGAVAPSATVVYVYSTDVITSLTNIIDNKLAPIASISYGDCESATGFATLQAENQMFMQANAEGITVLGPGGDSGATDCDYTATNATLPLTSATHGLAVDFPASSPNVTGLGGTMFNEGTGSYFSTSNDGNGGSAISYIPEAVWNETAVSIGSGGGLAAGGGGVSAYFTKPYWQTGTGVPSDSARDVPDVSLNAAANHDGYLFCSQGSCVNGFRGSPNANCPSGCFAVVGGTSVATPAFAGILALVQQKIGNATGNANPVLYALANSTYNAAVFHDVTVGNNASPCTAGSTDCPSGGSIGYNAGTGYDLASGWGSVDAMNLVQAWALVTPVAAGNAGTEASTTTVTESTVSVMGGATVTVTATVANGGTATETAQPTGTVQFLVDNVASGGPATVTGGVATLALATAGLASGSHSVVAAYSGDSVYAGSKGSILLDVVSATAADFTLTPATATVTAKAGTDAPGISFTVTPVNGFTGQVTFVAGTTSSTLNASESFSVTPVTIGPTAAGTTTLTLSAYVVTGKAIGAAGKGGPQMSLRSGAQTGGQTPGTTPLGARGEPYVGSGAALAFVILVMVPRRRRFKGPVGLAVAVAALGATMVATIGTIGCGSNTSNIPTTTDAVPGTYTINVSATGKDAAGVQVTHSSVITFVVQ